MFAIYLVDDGTNEPQGTQYGRRQLILNLHSTPKSYKARLGNDCENDTIFKRWIWLIIKD